MLERHGPVHTPKRYEPSFSEIVRNTLNAGFTLRRYGQNRELTRRMLHRFPASKLKCDGNMQQVLAESVWSSNALLRQLRHAGR